MIECGELIFEKSALSQSFHTTVKRFGYAKKINALVSRPNNLNKLNKIC